MSYQKHLEACQTINSFMGDLGYRYKASDYHQIWNRMDANRKAFGDIFTAATIRKDPTAAELALIQPRKHCVTVESEHPEDPDPAAGQRFHHIPFRENPRSIARKFVALMVAGLIALVLITVAFSQMSINRSDAVIARADRILEAGR